MEEMMKEPRDLGPVDKKKMIEAWDFILSMTLISALVLVGMMLSIFLRMISITRDGILAALFMFGLGVWFGGSFVLAGIIALTDEDDDVPELSRAKTGDSYINSGLSLKGTFKGQDNHFFVEDDVMADKTPERIKKKSFWDIFENGKENE